MIPAAAPRDKHWDVIVVGAGLGGLSAAASLACRGQRVLVVEQHDVPGGYAHKFLRRARGGPVYHFDVALHQMGGLDEGRWLPRALHALGVMPRLRLFRFATAYRTRGPAHDLVVDADATAYQQQLATLFPAHVDGLHALFATLAAADHGPSGPAAAASPSPPSLSLLGRTLADLLAEHVPDERFCALFSPLWAYLGLPPAELCAFSFAQVWASYHLGGCYYIAGGGQALADALVAVITEAGGQVLLRQPVLAIDGEAGRATGVTTRDHGLLRAPVVISNASATQTFTRLLPEQLFTRADARISAQLPPSVSLLETYVGWRGDAAALGLPDRLLFEQPSYDLDACWRAIVAGDATLSPRVVANHNLSDPGAVPPGRSVLNVAVLAAGARWMNLSPADYQREKQAAERLLLAPLRAALPAFDEHLEICETGTPHTMARYSWNPAGAVYGIAPSPRSHPLRRPRPRSGLRGLYLAGAWTFPMGGFHGALTSGLHTAALVAQDLALPAGLGPCQPEAARGQ